MEADDEREFVDYVVHRTAALLRVAYALTGDQHAAEDLVQTALAKGFSRWRHIRGDAEPYLKKIIYHESVSRWRRARFRAETVVAQVPERPSQDGTEDTNLRIVLREALLSLPARQRAVLVLRYLEDMSVDETAEMLGCRPGTVASQASRALAKLRDLVPSLSRNAGLAGTAGVPKAASPSRNADPAAADLVRNTVPARITDLEVRR